MRWIEVSVDATPSWVEAVGDALLRHCPHGFSDGSAGRARHRLLRAYLPADAAGRARLRLLRHTLLGLVGRSNVRTRVVRDTGWAAVWKMHARPTRVGRVLIQPSGRMVGADRRRDARATARAGIRAVIRLDPGMAFGSGEHASTQLCLGAIERHVRPRSIVIDLGTGSGILAITAALFGARHVLAIDNDPVAVAVARANVRRNGVARRVMVRRREGVTGVRLRVDLIVANLTADILPAVIDDMSRCLGPGGRVVASGFGSPRVSGVRRRMAAAGLRVVATQRLRGWCAVHAVRR